jgi:hypothetical protein
MEFTKSQKRNQRRKAARQKQTATLRCGTCDRYSKPIHTNEIKHKLAIDAVPGEIIAIPSDQVFWRCKCKVIEEAKAQEREAERKKWEEERRLFETAQDEQDEWNEQVLRWNEFVRKNFRPGNTLVTVHDVHFKLFGRSVKASFHGRVVHVTHEEDFATKHYRARIRVCLKPRKDAHFKNVTLDDEYKTLYGKMQAKGKLFFVDVFLTGFQGDTRFIRRGVKCKDFCPHICNGHSLGTIEYCD